MIESLSIKREMKHDRVLYSYLTTMETQAQKWSTKTIDYKYIDALLFYWLSLLSLEVIGRLTMTAFQRSSCYV
jgi:hypothetical protein